MWRFLLLMTVNEQICWLYLTDPGCRFDRVYLLIAILTDMWNYKATYKSDNRKNE